MPGVSHTIRDLQQSRSGDPTINLHEQRVNTYPAYPQSTLDGSVPASRREWHSRCGGCRSMTCLAGWKSLPSSWRPGSAELGIRRVNVQVIVEAADAAGSRCSTPPSPSTPRPAEGCARFRRSGRAEPTIRFKADVYLDAALAPGGVEHWPLPWRVAAGGRIYVDAEDLLDVVSVRVELDDPTVLDHDTAVDVSVEAVLNTDRPSLQHYLGCVQPNIACPARRGGRSDGSATCALSSCVETFRRRGEPPFQSRAITTIDGVHRVRNPFGHHWKMELHATADWSVTQALVCRATGVGC